LLLGIVLAGGASVRFGGVKVAEIVSGSPVLLRVIGALLKARHVGEVVVVATPHTMEHARRVVERLRGGAGGGEVSLVQDYYSAPCSGPVRGIVSPLLYGGGSEGAIVVPGDAPWLDTPTIESMIRVSRLSGAQVSAPIDGYGHPILPFIYLSREALKSAIDVCFLRAARSRVTDLLRMPRSLLLYGVGLVARGNPLALSTFNTPEELEKPARPPQLRASILVEGLGGMFMEACRREAYGDSLGAFSAYYSEYLAYRGLGVRVMETHALSDAIRAGRLDPWGRLTPRRPLDH
jgi:molybdopterin-guanine dinucleotide biosynthesis protein A